MTILERFIKYVKIDTQAQEDSTTFPSTLKQLKLADVLVDELKGLGIKNAFRDEYGYVYAKIDGTKPQTIGLIAHMDTALEVTDENVNPQIIESYDGKDIILKNGTPIKVNEFPFLSDLIGKKLVTTDGTTLLGADDKAGIAIIMQLLEVLPTIKEPMPSLFICFTPDEEIGDGTLHFNYDLFKVDFAYTLDGADIKYINYENFNAASADVTINGRSIHPGEAKDKLINSMEVAHEFHEMLPHHAKPEYTSWYEGFNHLTGIQGCVQQTKMSYIIRNHDKGLFDAQKELFKDIMKQLNQKYGEGTVILELVDSYMNMAELIKPHFEIVQYAIDALALHGIKAEIVPIRGGTDGARLSYGGILCPNLGTASYNHHGALEIANITQMEQMVEVLITMLTKVIE